MTRHPRDWKGRGKAIAASACAIGLALSLMGWPSPSQPLAPGRPGESVDEGIALGMGFRPTEFEIAPMVQKGSPTPGAWTTPIQELGIFGGILARAGITPGASDPARLVGRPGFLELIGPAELVPDAAAKPSYWKGTSNVLNDGGTRATFGYFVKVGFGKGLFEEYFILLSYDAIEVYPSGVPIGADDRAKGITGTPINAFEVFVFGPIPREGTSAHSTNPGALPLVEGMAVDINGRLLAEVPIALADVHNYHEERPEGTPVKPNVDTPGSGCLECHSRNPRGLPQSTSPFPWVEAFSDTPV